MTIAQAAARLGIAERQARRIAGRLPDTDRTEQPDSKGRARLMVRWDSMSRAQGRTATPDTGPDAAPDAGRTFAAPSTTLTLSYARVIEEQAAHIESLKAALAHEREQAQRITEALGREQQLRALEASTPRETFWERLWGRKDT